MSTNPEFDLAVSVTEQGYTVSLRAASGVDLPPEPLQLAMQLPALPAYRDIARFVAAAREIRLGADTELRDAKRVGGALFHALFPREVLSRFRAARDVLPVDGRLLLRLRLPPALIGIPWELLYDAPNDQFLALADDLALVRCPEMAMPLRPLQLAGPLQVVVVLASPRGVRAIDLDRELSRVQSALRGPMADNRVNLLVIRGPGTLEQLRRQMAKPVHVLHILCHGDLDERRGEGVLLFEDPSGDKDLISAAQLRLLIEKQRGQTRLVALNSCLGAVSGGNDPFGSVGAALMRGGVPAVVAMQFEIPAESAQELARIFYTDLADGRPIDMALTEARRHLFGYDSLRLDWAIPALFLRGNDGALFRLTSPPIPRIEAFQPPVPLTRFPKPRPSPDPPVVSLIDPTEQYRQAMTAFFAEEWEQAEYLLSTLVQASPSFRDAQSRLVEARLQLELSEQYTKLRNLRVANNWRAVQSGLAVIAKRKPHYADPDGLALWATAAQRREECFDLALEAVGNQQWSQAQRLLKSLLEELPGDGAAQKLLTRVTGELRKIEETARRQAEEQERQHKAADPVAEERQLRTAKARAWAIDLIATNIYKRAYTDALAQLSALLKTNPQGNEVAELVTGLIENRAVPLKERLQAGNLAGQYDDPRPGVISFPPAMVTFPGGQFQYGNTQAEYEAIIAEEKQNKLEVRNWYKDSVNTITIMVAPFELARYLVTNAQWAQFIAADGYRPNQSWWDAAGRVWLVGDDSITDGSITTGLQDSQKRDGKDQPSCWDDVRFGKQHPNYPVVGINWYESVAFCRWLTKHLDDGFTYLLPSELEWEYAVRGRERRMYAWGNQPPDGERANFNQTHSGTTAVGCFPAGVTPKGLLDMTGTVWEWTRSEYREYPYKADDGHEDGSKSGEKRFTVRGGSWYSRPRNLRASYRVSFTPDRHVNDLGLRLARYKK